MDSLDPDQLDPDPASVEIHLEREISNRLELLNHNSGYSGKGLRYYRCEDGYSRNSPIMYQLY